MNKKYKCTRGLEEWSGIIRSDEEFNGYYKILLEGRSSSIRTYYGHAGSEYWACFPDFSLSASLAHPNDIFWNIEKLTEVFGNVCDAITVAEGIKHHHNITNPPLLDFSQMLDNIKGRLDTRRIVFDFVHNETGYRYLVCKISRKEKECMIIAAPKRNIDICELDFIPLDYLCEHFGNSILNKDSPYIGMDYEKAIDYLNE